MSEFDNLNELNEQKSADETQSVENQYDTDVTTEESVCEQEPIIEEESIGEEETADAEDFASNKVEEQPFREAESFEPVKYSEIKREPVGSGVKIFALVMAIIILMTASCAVGYVIGGKRGFSGGNYFTETTLELAEKPDAEDAYTTAQVYDVVNKSVVGITVYNSEGKGSVATGVVYTEDGYIITNDHIYSDVVGAKFKIKTYDGNIYDAVFVAGDARSDLAVLKIDATGFYPATFGNSEQIVVGESVVAIGRPTGIDENSMTRGIISLKERRVSVNTSYSMRVIQTDTPINPGNSGGALVNMFGQVIGITSSKLGGEEYEGIGFAIPTTVTKSVVESLIQYGNVNNRCRLGISYQEIDAVAKEIHNYEVTGVSVAVVNEDSDLYGKVEVGDIITAVNGVEITSDDVILNAIEASKPGDTLEFTVYKKNGTTTTVTAKLLADVGSSSYQSELTLPSN